MLCNNREAKRSIQSKVLLRWAKLEGPMMDKIGWRLLEEAEESKVRCLDNSINWEEAREETYPISPKGRSIILIK